ncbi:MAG: gliding motility-associated C-terminal domain-containing protein [bacterium]|nr:gliding motility-associated C-terminal domain-containing protein [bacterium]
MFIFPVPTAKIKISDTLTCPDTPFSITVSGSTGTGGPLKGILIPSATNSLNLAPTNSLVLATTAFSTTSYSFSVIDTNACVSKPVEAIIRVQKPAPSIHTATTVVIGQLVQLNASAGPGYSYTWTPQTKNLSDSLIYNPVSNSTLDISYSVTLVDEPLHCFITVNSYSIFILPLTTVDVPTAFTPNGDGINDIIYADGWGIRKLIYFKIFDRWGQLLFESNDLKQGWDGTFEGVPQNIETYVYQVEAETYLETNPKVSKSGTFKLIR